MAGWIDTSSSRGLRTRRADVAVPDALSIELQAHRELIARWVRIERQEAARTTLLREGKDVGIERAEVACELLLRDGWIERRERLLGGNWQWHAILWRDLPGLQRVLGVAGRQQREEERRAALVETQAWLKDRAQNSEGPAIDPDLLDELNRALGQLVAERGQAMDVLGTRLKLLRAMADWHDSGAQGPRRAFALRACGDTKAISQADWRWLENSFDLERLRVEAFVPQLWLAGSASLLWSKGRLDLRAVHCVGLPVQDAVQVQRLQGVERYWFIENRASFERQARNLMRGVLLIWMPGRPSSAWITAVSIFLDHCPAPAWISADADPAGVDIACMVGAQWEQRGLRWEPHQMGLVQWQDSSQQWPLNDHDRVLLGRILERSVLDPGLRALCEAMLRDERKAEQEAWL